MQKHLTVTFFSHPQSRNTGDYLHRIIWPGKALSRYFSVEVIQSTHPQHPTRIRKTDILVINMIADAQLIELVNYRRKNNLTTIYEISDDFESFPKNLPLHGFYARQNVQDTIKQLAQACDGVQFSSPALQAKFGYLNKNSIILMNQCNIIQPLPAHTNKPLVIGWSGSIGHYDDAAWLADLLAHWKLRKQVRISIMASPVIHQLFRSHGLKITARPTGTMEDYLRYIRTLDIGIAIIKDDDFNQGRSDGKFLEYISNGVVALCSRLGTYQHTVKHGENGFLFQTGDELLSLLTQLVNDDKLRQALRNQGYHYACTERTHQANAEIRAKFYYALTESSQPEYTQSLEEAQYEYKEWISPIEEKFLSAMTLHQQNQLNEAFAIYTELLQTEPAFYLIWERMGQLMSQAGNMQYANMCFETAKQLNSFKPFPEEC